MKNGMENAVWQMKQKEEDGLNYIYSQTYNFVYLRAKSILKNEEDIKLFMQTVYVDLYRSADEIQLDNLYEWLGKHVYRIGCEHFKKRKEREAAFVEMEEEELNPKQKQHLNENVDVISKSLEQLPDLYQATLFAFYFDYLKMDEIADLMDCSVGVIINRLNYTRKYFKKREDILKKKEETNAELENITAFVGTNDFVAIGIMDAITSLGYRIPEDFSVCGFDNTLVASFSGISLTTIDHCIGEKGAYAVSMLRNQRTRMEQKDDKKEKKRPIMRLEYEPQLIIRHSTGKRR